MSVARRPLLTAAAAGILLCALWFVPSARGGDNHSSRHQQSAGYSRGSGSQQLALGGSDGVGATPYLIAGSAVLAAGAGFGVHVIRRRARPA